jgi:hypothetical protein
VPLQFQIPYQRWILALAIILSSTTGWSQLNDSFTDSDFSANPAWTGNTDKFIVNTSQQVQLNDVAAGQSALSTSFASTSLQDKEWQIWVKQNFAGSDANQSRIYFACNGTPATYTGTGSAGVTGYFLKLGEGGSTDAIRLYKDDGTQITELGAGTVGLISASFQIRIRITRNAAALWSIEVDNTGGTNFTPEFSVTDNSFTAADHFGMICSYTVSNINDFFFDDIYFGNTIVDTTPPALVSITVINNNQIDVLFSENISPASAQNESLFNASGGLGQATLATLDGTNLALVHLTFLNPFQDNLEYTLTIGPVQDLNGNAMSNTTGNFTYVVLVEAGFRDIVFNEILADPTPVVTLPEFEFIELYNASTNTYDLAGWQLVNSTTPKILTNQLIAPGETVILCDVSAVSAFSTFGNVMGITSFSALANTGDSLTLVGPEAQVVDVLVYSDSWFATATKAAGGWTLEQINPQYPCANNATNWSESSDASGGTPDATNSVFDPSPDNTAPIILSGNITGTNQVTLVFSEPIDTTGFTTGQIGIIPFNSADSFFWSNGLTVLNITSTSALVTGNTYSITVSGLSDCSGNAFAASPFNVTSGFAPAAGDLIINEIMADPDVNIGTPDEEFIEIFNTTSTVIELTGIHLNSGYFTSQVLIQPNGYKIVANITNAAAFNAFPDAAFMTSFPSLTNSGSTITLSDANNVTLDEVSYTDQWYNDASKAQGGYSLELINPDATCGGRYNWTASNATNGNTANAINSVFDNSPDVTAPYVISSRPLSLNQIFIQFSESMDVNSATSLNTTLAPSNSVSNPTWNADLDGLTLNTGLPLVIGQVYTLNISVLNDCSGNSISTLQATFVKGYDPLPGEIIINEIMAAPNRPSGEVPANPAKEFIEIHNLTSNVVELTNIKVNNGFFTQQVLLQPDSFIVIADDGASPFDFISFPNTALMSGFPSLTDGGSTITLKDQNDAIIDEVTYSLAFYHDTNKDGGGYSMELINPNDPCSSSDNWHATNAYYGSTAGYKNSVFDITPDVVAPQFSLLINEPQNAVTLVFDEPLDAASLSSLQWTVNGVLVANPQAALTLDENNGLQLSYGAISAGVIYTFQLIGVTDCWGNAADAITGRFALPETASAGDIIINELLYNPPGSDTRDFVEIYNRSDKNISLKNWSLADDAGGIPGASKLISDVEFVLFPGEFLILTNDGTRLKNYYPGTIEARIWQMESTPDYSSTADVVYLLMPDGSPSDVFVYDDQLQFPLLNSDDGISLERIAYTRPASDRTNWHSASELVHFATPGYRNSQAANAALSEDDLVAEPEIFSPDNDGYNDVVTFYYTLDKQGYVGNLDIYDSEGRKIKKVMTSELLGLTGSISWDGFKDDNQKASIGIYIAFFEIFHTDGSTSKIKKTCVLAHQLD